jgi:four helix bundle protein
MGEDDMEDGEQPGSGSGSGSAAGSGLDGRTRDSKAGAGYFDHERLEVYRVAREFVVLANQPMNRKMPRELRDQFDRASMSMLSNIGEGAGKTAKADKQRSYEIARGSTTEAATQLELMCIRGIISDADYQQARPLLVRVAQMLSRLCGRPRVT